MTDWDLIADIGGTHLRVAAWRGDAICDIAVFDSKADMPIRDVLADYIAGFDTAPNRASLAIAGVIKAGKARLTNAGGEVTLAEVKTLCAGDARFINDFEAAGWALAKVGAGDVSPIYTGTQTGDIPKGTRVICGIGTGLGIGALIDNGNQICAISGEGGHCALLPHNNREADIFTALIALWSEVRFHKDALVIEAEAILSGTALPILYRAICQVNNAPATLTTARDILDAAQAGGDKNAGELAQIFRGHLAQLCGDLAVTFNAQGGVFLCGGVLEHNPWLFDDDFIKKFHAGGRFTALRQSCPLYHYHNPQLGLIGATNALRYYFG